MLQCLGVLYLAKDSETQLVQTIVHSVITYNIYRSFNAILRFFDLYLFLFVYLVDFFIPTSSSSNSYEELLPFQCYFLFEPFWLIHAYSR